jgi:hypothetical protein
MKHSASTSSCEESIYLIGFKIYPGKKEQDLYTLFIFGEEEKPLMVDNHMIFFNKVELASMALSLGDDRVKRLTPTPKKVALTCDISRMLNLIEVENFDSSSTILNCLNTILDLVKATKRPMPIKYKKILYKFADHLTFEREYSNFITEHNISRVAIINAILWCFGAILLKAKVLNRSGD